MANSERLRENLRQHHLHPDKKLGQHYLIDAEVLAKIVRAADVKKDELVLEIGAGPGILTKALAQAGANVLAVEFDRDFCHLLQDEFHNWRNVHVLCEDALRLDLNSLQREAKPYKKIVANIPYQITNPLVRKILSPGSQIETAVLLIQKEVAERLCAQPGNSNRGLLTVMVELYGKIESIADVPPTAFWPSPKVDSTVVRLKRAAREKPLINEPAFFWLVKQGFSGKRKVIGNSLSGGLQTPKDEANALLKRAGIDAQLRAEDLDLTQWLRLYELYAAESVGK